MSIRIVCPSCRKVYNLDESSQGKTVRCRECRSPISVPALARQGRRDDGNRPADDRITMSSRPASAAGSPRRDDDDRPRRRPAERQSLREGKDSQGSNHLVLIILGVGAAVLVLGGLVLGGVIFFFVSIRSGSNPAATVDRESSPVAIAGKADAPPGPVDLPPVGPVPGFGLQGDLAALRGTWQSGPVNADGGGGTGTIKLSISPQRGTQGGRLRVALATKRAGRTTSSTLNYSFTLQQKGDDRLLVTHIRRGMRGTARGIVFAYRFEGGQLILSGAVASGRMGYTLKNVALRRTAAEPETAVAGNPGNPPSGAGGGGKGSPAALKITGDVFSFVAEAARENRLTDVDIRGFTLSKNTYRDICAEGGVLIGFQFGLGKFVNNDIVKSVRPIFLTKNGEQFGQWHGPVPAAPITVKAKPGYVVSEVSVRSALSLDALRLTFAKLGKEGLDLRDNYNGESVGGNGGQPSMIDGKGALFVGVTGHLGGDGAPCSLGLVAVLPKN